MSTSSRSKQLRRRDFLKIGLAGATTVAAGVGGFRSVAEALTTLAQAAPAPTYRTLGRTGLKVTTLGFGAMLTPESEVIRAGFDMGINYVDTARRYLNGRSEEIVSRALKGIRDKVYVATKTVRSSITRDDVMKDIETSLAQLKTDHIDIIQVHGLESGKQVLIPGVREAYVKAKEQGKVRFFGVSTHTNPAEVVNAVVDDPDKFFDTVLVTYNYNTDPAVKQAIARAHAAGIGVIAMKIQMGGYKTREDAKAMTHEQAAANLKWVLQDTNVATTIPGMRTVEQVAHMVPAMGAKMTKADERILKSYAQAIDPFYCRLCGQCEGTCPNGVAISTVNRALMYAEGYREYGLAKATFDEVSNASACATCSGCVARCVKGLNIAQKMDQARNIFA
ncbi:MAG: putative oxidoreductase of aldo/keto reductase family [Deltaproteobacteria bacterium]|nr:putative oxidoreductase of aldo/keto reductase family [Deltaproteobacteria bacterium]